MKNDERTPPTVADGDTSPEGGGREERIATAPAGPRNDRKGKGGKEDGGRQVAAPTGKGERIAAASVSTGLAMTETGKAARGKRNDKRQGGKTIDLGPYGANERQKLFFLDRHKFVAYGGARGGGKSWAVRTKAVLLCLRYPGIKVMILRSTYPELQKNHIEPLCALLHVYDQDKKKRVARYNDQKKTMSFPNGSLIYFGYCDSDPDAGRYQGTEVDVLFVDEATHQPEERMQKLQAIVRGVNGFPKRVYYTCNPGGVGHGWVKRLFIDRAYQEGERPEDYSFIQALVTDNRALMEADPDYIHQLEALPPKLRDAWLHGRWDLFEGQFFEDFRAQPDLTAAQERGFDADPEELRRERRFTHVIEPFDVAAGECRGWKIYRSYDWGYGKPFSCGWWAVDYDGVLYRILELYGWSGTPDEGCKWPTDKQFREIARIEREHRWLRGREILGVADPSIWNSNGGESIAETANKCGVYFTPGDNERLPGWMQCHYRLQFDEQGYPRMYVFEGCKAFIRTVPLLVYSKTAPEDLDTTQEDHVADEWRYMCMARPITPVVPEEKAPLLNDPLDRYAGRKFREARIGG